jgi:site-specific DNA-methyltransferase (adenine-specific)
MSESFLNNRVHLHIGDCRDVLAQLEGNSLDACVTDPPYHLTSIVKRFGATSEADDTITSDRVRRRADGYARLVAGGFMGKIWDGGDIAFDPETWRAVFRVLKPGAHLLAMGGTRTYHRLACAIEDAGFEIRDCIQWLYGSGFPKSHDVSKGIDRAAGVEREIIGDHPSPASKLIWGNPGVDNWRDNYNPSQAKITAPTTAAACQWEGWGTALKPACEMIVLARKPLSEGTVAANVLRWGTGAINVDGCRVGVRERPKVTDPKHNGHEHNCYGAPSGGGKLLPDARWPANVIHDGSEEVVAAFPETTSGESGGTVKVGLRGNVFIGNTSTREGDTGSAARFFYQAKADQDDRIGSRHPTIKPLDLMQYLVRLITPPKGTCLDPFAGTGTLGEAAWREGMSVVLIEREDEYCADIRRRMALALAGPDERARESIKAKNLPIDHGPLFSGIPEAEAL